MTNPRMPLQINTNLIIDYFFFSFYFVKPLVLYSIYIYKIKITSNFMAFEPVEMGNSKPRYN